MGWLFWLSVISQASLAISILARGMGRSYRCFVALLLVAAATCVPLLWIPHASYAYTYFWMSVMPVLWVLRFAAVAEAYHLFISCYPDMGKASRHMFFLTLGTSAVVSLVLLPIEIPHVLRHQGLVTAYSSMLIAQRFLSLSMALSIVSIGAFHLRFYLPIRRNTTVHGILLAVYLSLNAGETFLGIQKGTPWLFEYALPASFALIILWTLAYTRSGERLPDLPQFTEQDRALLAQGDDLRVEIAELAEYFRRGVSNTGP